jgi:hypothetical protein
MGTTRVCTYRIEYESQHGKEVVGYTKLPPPFQKAKARPNLKAAWAPALAQWVADLEASERPGGVNAHCAALRGGPMKITKAWLIRQSDASVISAYSAN